MGAGAQEEDEWGRQRSPDHRPRSFAAHDQPMCASACVKIETSIASIATTPPRVGCNTFSIPPSPFRRWAVGPPFFEDFSDPPRLGGKSST